MKLRKNAYEVRSESIISAASRVSKSRRSIGLSMSKNLKVDYNKIACELDITDYIEASSAEIDINAPKTEEDTKIIIDALNNHFIFTSLSEEYKEVVAENMQLYISVI